MKNISILFVGGILVVGGIATATMLHSKKNSDSWPGCCDADAFLKYSMTAKSWDEYKPMIIRYSQEAIRKESQNPLQGFSDAELDKILTCTYTHAIDDLRTDCPSVQTYLTYEGGTSKVFQRDLLLQNKCALRVSQSTVKGQVYMQQCLVELGFKK